MKYSIGFAMVLVCAAACHSRQPTIYADNEGPRVSGQPPLVRAARIEDPSLRRLQRGRIVIHTAVGFQPMRAVVTVASGAASSGSFTDTTSTRGDLESRPLLPGEYLVSARRVGVVPQLVRIQVTVGFADTLLFTLGQP